MTAKHYCLAVIVLSRYHVFVYMYIYHLYANLCESFLLFLSLQVYDPELAKKIDDFVDQLKNLLQVEKPFTLVRDGALLVIHSEYSSANNL